MFFNLAEHRTHSGEENKRWDEENVLNIHVELPVEKKIKGRMKKM